MGIVSISRRDRLEIIYVLSLTAVCAQGRPAVAEIGLPQIMRAELLHGKAVMTVDAQDITGLRHYLHRAICAGQTLLEALLQDRFRAGIYVQAQPWEVI